VWKSSPNWPFPGRLLLCKPLFEGGFFASSPLFLFHLSPGVLFFNPFRSIPPLCIVVHNQCWGTRGTFWTVTGLPFLFRLTGGFLQIFLQPRTYRVHLGLGVCLTPPPVPGRFFFTCSSVVGDFLFLFREPLFRWSFLTASDLGQGSQFTPPLRSGQRTVFFGGGPTLRGRVFRIFFSPSSSAPFVVFGCLGMSYLCSGALLSWWFFVKTGSFRPPWAFGTYPPLLPMVKTPKVAKRALILGVQKNIVRALFPQPPGGGFFLTLGPVCHGFPGFFAGRHPRRENLFSPPTTRCFWVYLSKFALSFGLSLYYWVFLHPPRAFLGNNFGWVGGEHTVSFGGHLRGTFSNWVSLSYSGLFHMPSSPPPFSWCVNKNTSFSYVFGGGGAHNRGPGTVTCKQTRTKKIQPPILFFFPTCLNFLVSPIRKFPFLFFLVGALYKPPLRFVQNYEWFTPFLRGIQTAGTQRNRA